MSRTFGHDVGGLVDEGWWRARQDDYLASATTVTFLGSPLNVIDHLEWRRRSSDHDFDPNQIEADAVQATLDEHAVVFTTHPGEQSLEPRG